MQQELVDQLAASPPFDSLTRDELVAVVQASSELSYGTGDLVFDAFREARHEVFVVLQGRIDLWHIAEELTGPPDESVGPGEIFGFSALLTERSVGPRAIAAIPSTVLRVPSDAATKAFTNRRGVQFLANHLSTVVAHRAAVPPSYSLISDVISAPPVVLAPDASISDAAHAMEGQRDGVVVINFADQHYELVTDASLRQRVLVDGVAPSAPVTQALAITPHTVRDDDSVAEGVMAMLEQGADHLIVVRPDGVLSGVASLRDFVVSSTVANFSLHEQLRRCESLEELTARARGIPTLLDDLLTRGLASGKVISLNSTLIDAVVRRAIDLVFAAHQDLDTDLFTWVSMGSNGRREAVLSSDVDSSVVFSDITPADQLDRFRAAFGEIHGALAAAGFAGDGHGATASNPAFSLTSSTWAEDLRAWISHPEMDDGAVKASLLVDGRPIYGDSLLPVVQRLFHGLRSHPGTMRLLLTEALSRRARLAPHRTGLLRRPGLVDIKSEALLPLVNMARWSALNVGSTVLPTTDRLKAAAGSAMMPEEQAARMIEVFNVLQLIRLRYQLMQVSRGERPTDTLVVERMSPIDRSVVAQSVREISAIQKRMTNIGQFLSPEEWASPADGRA